METSINTSKKNTEEDTLINQIIEMFDNGEYDLLHTYSDKIRTYIIKPCLRMIYHELFPYIIISSIFILILVLIIFIQFFIILFYTRYISI